MYLHATLHNLHWMLGTEIEVDGRDPAFVDAERAVTLLLPIDRYGRYLRSIQVAAGASVRDVCRAIHAFYHRPVSSTDRCQIRQWMSDGKDYCGAMRRTLAHPGSVYVGLLGGVQFVDRLTIHPHEDHTVVVRVMK